MNHTEERRTHFFTQTVDNSIKFKTKHSDITNCNCHYKSHSTVLNENNREE